MKHHFNRLPEYHTERIMIIYPLVRKDDPSAKQEMVESYMRLAIQIAKGLSYRCPNDYSELITEAMYLLTNGVDRISKGALDQFAKPDPRRYLQIYIRKSLLAWTTRNKLFSVNSLTYRRKGGAIPSIALYGDMDKWEGDCNQIVDLLEGCALGERERRIIQLRLESYTDCEIGEQLNLTGARVCQIRKEIGNRLLTKIGQLA